MRNRYDARDSARRGLGYAGDMKGSFVRWFDNIPRVTRALLVANIGAFVLQLMLGAGRLDPLMLWPIGSGLEDGRGFMPWQLLSYGFLHDGFGHLLFNMLALFMFGAPLEHVWKGKRFLTFYLACVAGAAVCQLLVGAWMMRNGAPPYATLGASGGVFGLLLGYGMLFPNQRVAALPFPVFMRARTLVIIYGVVALLMGLAGRQPGVAHFAHLGGMVFGYLLIRYWRRPKSPPPRGGRRDGPRLRVVK